MAQRGRPTAAQRRGRRWTILWVAVVLAVVITLMVTEQIAVLYLLATLSVAALLVIVSFADLRGARQATEQLAPGDDSAAIGDRTAKTAAASFGSTTSRAARPRRK